MAASLFVPLIWTLLVFSFFMTASADQRIITAEPGDNVILPCRAAENEDVIAVEWRRTDLGPGQKVLLYRNSQFYPDLQSPSFRNRVDLLDVENKDVSLVLKDVTTDDRGTYECEVVQIDYDAVHTDLISIIDLRVKPGQINITAEPGDNVILPCRAAENKDVIIVEWSRTDLRSDQYVLYRNNQFDLEHQSPSFINRVDLLDMRNGDVSLVLKNVTTDDTGTYECRVVQGGKNRRKRSFLITDPICIINLRVKPGQINITAEPGDNVILPCRAAENKDVRDSQFHPEAQSPSFRNRVDLLDMKNGDVSLVLKDVTTDDTGTYECRVVQGGNNRRKRSLLDTEPICIINLRVEPGNKIGQIVLLSIRGFLIVVIPAVVVSALCRRSRDSSPRSNRPPAAAADAEETLTGLDE